MEKNATSRHFSAKWTFGSLVVSSSEFTIAKRNKLELGLNDWICERLKISTVEIAMVEIAAIQMA